MRLAVARAIARGLPADDWADAFPQEGDVSIAELVVMGALAETGPWQPQVWGPWEVRLRAQDVLIGTAGFHGPPVHGVVEVGYGIAASHQRQGLGTEAVADLLGFARDRGVRRVVAHVAPGNVASRRLLAVLGFEEGIPGEVAGERGELELHLDL